MSEKYIELNSDGRIHCFIEVNDNNYADYYDVDWSLRDGCYYCHLSGGGPFEMKKEFVMVGNEFDIWTIAGDANVEYCGKCKSNISTDNLCKHIWWSNKIEWWSTPDDRKRKVLAI